jgi:predicted metal-dependent hydrolase
MSHSNGNRPGPLVIRYGGEEIPVEVSFRDRKDLAISVYPDLRVEVVAPTGADLEQILQRATRRAPWIVKQRRFFEQYQPKLPPPRYISGETFLYLGRHYRLKVVRGCPPGAKLIGRFLMVTVPEPGETDTVRRHVLEWYRKRAQVVFPTRLALCLDSSRSLALSPPRLVIRRMAKRWGSCTKDGTILLNTELVRVPVHCIDYVIVHELCHLVVHGHSPEFYRLLGRVMPDWESRKERLDSGVGAVRLADDLACESTLGSD